MKLIKFLIIFFLFLNFKAFSQGNPVFISNNDKKLDKVFTAPDSIYQRLIASVTANISLKNGDKIASYSVNVTNCRADTIIYLPSYYSQYNVLNIALYVDFDAYGKPSHYLFEPFRENKEILQKYLDTNLVKRELYFPYHGGTKSLGRSEEKHFIITEPYQPQKCNIISIPKGISADVYYCKENVWTDYYHFPAPPSSEKITKVMVDSIRGRHLGNCIGEVLMNKDDRLYVLIFDHNGVYTATVFNPSQAGNEYPVQVK